MTAPAIHSIKTGVQCPLAFARSLRVIALASVLAIATMGLPALHASAQDNDPDPGVRCAAKVGPGEYEFYLPGEKATDVNGNKWVCGPDGQWFRDYSSAQVIDTTPAIGVHGALKGINTTLVGSNQVGTHLTRLGVRSAAGMQLAP